MDVLDRELARVLDARHIALLIANFSGSALVRLSHVTGTGREQDGRNERAESVQLPGTAHERVLFAQALEVMVDGEGWLVLVPVTERGDAIGVLEVSLSSEPDTDTLDYLVAAAHALAYVLIASRRHTYLFEWAQRDIPFSSRRRSSVACCRPRIPPRRGRSAWPDGWSRPMTPAGTASTTPSIGSTCMS